ncbi:hypothetical protein [uncultured Roseobacter sp.]|uniref:hypothetical protein n=1 Tax=uncultured Roseobacter sp. TaxID=114847 RepID=UPI00262B2FB7|nr:hypothetical protein [uncultured Roseobacter sp.]
MFLNDRLTFSYFRAGPAPTTIPVTWVFDIDRFLNDGTVGEEWSQNVIDFSIGSSNIFDELQFGVNHTRETNAMVYNNVETDNCGIPGAAREAFLRKDASGHEARLLVTFEYIPGVAYDTTLMLIAAANESLSSGGAGANDPFTSTDYRNTVYTSLFLPDDVAMSSASGQFLAGTSTLISPVPLNSSLLMLIAALATLGAFGLRRANLNHRFRPTEIMKS